jgi:HEAT repeat protein
MAPKNILSLLAGGDRRSIGRSDEVATLVSRNPKLFVQLMAGLRSEDPLVRMRAADAAEKITRADASLLEPHKKELLALLAEAEQQELRWHLTAMIPRLRLGAIERRIAAQVLRGYLDDRSSIVKTFALQGLADLAQDDAKMRPGIIELLRKACRSGTPAMKARSRKLLARLERL